MTGHEIDKLNVARQQVKELRTANELKRLELSIKLKNIKMLKLDIDNFTELLKNI